MAVDDAKNIEDLAEAVRTGEISPFALAETFRALGDATRVRILHALSHAEVCVCDLAASMNVTESAVSHQLRALRNGGYKLVARDRRVFTSCCCCLCSRLQMITYGCIVQRSITLPNPL